VRVFRNKSNIRYRYKIHEQINASLLDNGYKINIEKKSRIIHLVSASENTFLDKKQKYYFKLLNESLKNEPDEPWLNYQKAKTLWYFNKLQEALDIFLSIAKNKSNPLDIRTSSFNQAAIVLGILKKYNLAFTCIEKSLQLIKEQSLAYSVAYNLYYDTNQFENAINAIKKVKTTIDKCKWQNIIPGDLYINKDIRNYKIGLCYLAEKKLSKAKYNFRKGINFNPESSENYYGLAVLEAYQNNSIQSKINIKKCLRFNPDWEEALKLKQFLFKIKT
jgi:tetratricopeptide (TPR) repeat protein